MRDDALVSATHTRVGTNVAFKRRDGNTEIQKIEFEDATFERQQPELGFERALAQDELAQDELAQDELAQDQLAQDRLPGWLSTLRVESAVEGRARHARAQARRAAFGPFGT